MRTLVKMITVVAIAAIVAMGFAFVADATYPGPVVSVAKGGTGVATITTGNLVVGAGTSPVTFVAPGTNGNFVQSNGSTWAGATTLGVANGGTGANTLTANNLVVGNGTSAVSFVAPSTSGKFLQSNGTTWGAATTLGVANGGTGATTLTSGNLLVGAGASAPTYIAPSATAGYVVASDGTNWGAAQPGPSLAPITTEKFAWYLNEAAGASTVVNYGSISGANITTIAGTTFGLLCPWALCPSFSGSNSKLTSPTGKPGTATTTATLIAWFKATSVATGNIIAVKAYNTGGTWSTPYATIGLAVGSSGSGILTGFLATGSAVSTILDSAGGVVSAGAYHQAVAIYNGTNFLLYLDAVQVASTAIATNLDWHSGSDGSWIIGGRNDTTAPFAGNISDVRYFDTAFTATQVQASYKKNNGWVY